MRSCNFGPLLQCKVVLKYFGSVLLSNPSGCDVIYGQILWDSYIYGIMQFWTILEPYLHRLIFQYHRHKNSTPSPYDRDVRLWTTLVY